MDTLQNNLAVIERSLENFTIELDSAMRKTLIYLSVLQEVSEIPFENSQIPSIKEFLNFLILLASQVLYLTEFVKMSIITTIMKELKTLNRHRFKPFTSAIKEH